MFHWVGLLTVRAEELEVADQKAPTLRGTNVDIRVVEHQADPGVDDTAAVLRALVAEPRAVVYDLTEVTGVSADLADTFDTIHAYLGHWAATPLLVAVPDPAQAQALHAHPLGACVTTCPNLGAALEAARRHPDIDHAALDLDPDPTAPRHARHLVDQALTAWNCRQLLHPAAVVVSELVTNAVLHAHTALTVSISRPHIDTDTDTGADAGPRLAAVRVAVRDADSTRPRLAQPHAHRQTGRGLQLIEAIAQSWGVVPLGAGKVVWAVLDDHATTSADLHPPTPAGQSE